MSANGFVNLHNHSDYSLLDGYSHPAEYIQRAAEMGQTAVGLTDHGNLFGAFEFIKAARAAAKTYDRKKHQQTPVFVKPIIGIEAYMAPQNPDGARCKSPVFYNPELNDLIRAKKLMKSGDRSQMDKRERMLRSLDVSSRGAYTHLTLFAINDIGFHNLIYLTTESSKRENFYQRGRMDFEMLSRWNEGIIATTGCPSGEVQTRLRLGQKKEAYAYAERMAELFDGRYYVEVMSHNMKIDLERDALPKLVQLARDLHLPLLATNDSHYAKPEDSIHHEEMLCIQTRSRSKDNNITMSCLTDDDPREDITVTKTLPNGKSFTTVRPRRFAFNGNDYYLKSYEEMIRQFPEDQYPDAVSNTVRIADMVGDWWVKGDGLELEALENKYADTLKQVQEQFLDEHGEATLPHASGGRTTSIVKANKGVTYTGMAEDASNVDSGFEVDPLTQQLIDDDVVCIGPYDMSLNTDLRPEIQIPEGWTEEEWFKKKINEGFLQRRVAMGDSDDILEESKRRIKDEFPVFAGKNFIQYMLVVQDYIRWAREHGVSVGEGRGCFLPGSPVAMEDGSVKSIEDVREGDYVVTHDGTARRVLDRFRYDVHDEDCVTVTFNDGRAIECTADHMLYVDKVGFVKASDLEAGYVLSGHGNPESAADCDDGDGTTGNDGMTVDSHGRIGGVHVGNGVFVSLKDEDEPRFVWYDSWDQLRLLNILETDSMVRSFTRLGDVSWSVDGMGHSGCHGSLPMFLVAVDDGLSGIRFRVIALSGETEECTGYQDVLDWAESRGIPVDLWSSHDIDRLSDFHHVKSVVASVSRYRYDGAVYDLHVDGVHNYTIAGVTVHNSVGGSEIAYLMDISRTDPVRHDLIFERFLNPERNSPPDVDTDFQASRRLRVLQYAKDKYGYDQVANIITFGTFKFKQAFRDMAKIYDMTNDEVDSISKLIPDAIEGREPSMEDMFDPESDFYPLAADFREALKDEKWKPIINSTSSIVSRVRQTGTHACGVIMSSKPIRDYAPLYWEKNEKKAKENIWVDCMVAWEYPDLESLGLIKMDFLPLSNLDIIDNAIDNIAAYNDTIDAIIKDREQNRESVRELERDRLAVPELDNIEVHGFDDPETYRMLARGDSDAVFQLSSDGQKSLLKRIQPDGFEDIVAINALYRPGPMSMNAHLEYADRKNGKTPVYVINKELDKKFRGTPVDDILSPTYGLMLYQEQAMQISRLLCGFTRGQADSLRKAMGHKIPEEMEANHKRFIDGAMRLAKEHGWRFSIPDVESLWSYIADFSKYGFNRSHSVSYAINAYKTAYLKAHYPRFFMASVLTENMKKKDKFPQLFANALETGLRIGPVSVNKSRVGITAAYKVNQSDPDIVFGFDKASGVNSDQAKAIVDMRNANGGVFHDFDDFMMHMDPHVLNAKGLEGLADAGAFDEFGLPRKSIALQAKDIVAFYRKKQSVQRENATSLLGIMMAQQGQVYDSMGAYDLGLTGNPNIDEYSYTERLAKEKAALSVYVSDTPMSNAGDGLWFMSKYPDYWRRRDIASIQRELADGTATSDASPHQRYDRGTPVRIIGYFSKLEKRRLRSGSGYWYSGTFTDDSGGSIDMAVWSSTIRQLEESMGIVVNKDNDVLREDTLYDMDVSWLRDGTVRVNSVEPVIQLNDGSVPLVFRVSSEQAVGKAHIRGLFKLLEEHPGDTPVLIDIAAIRDPEEYPRFHGVSLQAGPHNLMPFRVDIRNPEVLAKLENAALGSHCMTWEHYRNTAGRDPLRAQ